MQARASPNSASAIASTTRVLPTIPWGPETAGYPPDVPAHSTPPEEASDRSQTTSSRRRRPGPQYAGGARRHQIHQHRCCGGSDRKHCCQVCPHSIVLIFSICPGLPDAFPFLRLSVFSSARVRLFPDLLGPIPVFLTQILEAANPLLYASSSGCLRNKLTRWPRPSHPPHHPETPHPPRFSPAEARFLTSNPHSPQPQREILCTYRGSKLYSKTSKSRKETPPQKPESHSNCQR